MDKSTVGLFGTCGNSLWRVPFIDYLQKNKITYYNPQLPPGTWKPECAVEENYHLRHDRIVLFPVTNETTGAGSLAEIGFSILSTIRHLREDQYLVIMIDDDCMDPSGDAIAIKNSRNARTLVKTKVKEITHPRIILVDHLNGLMTVMISILEHLHHLDKLNNCLEIYRS